MALPVGISTITVTGQFLDPRGNPVKGMVTFTPTATLTDTAGMVILTRAPINCPLDTTGAFTTALVCTNATAVQPTPFFYQVNFAIPYTSESPFTIYLPTSLGSTVDISSLAPIPAPATPAAGIYVSQVNGQTGSVTVTEISGVTVSGTPATGQVLTATSPVTADWQASGGGTGWPGTTLGDTVYGGAGGTETRLPGNTTATRQYLTQAGTGSVSAAPGWNTIAAGDVPTLNQDTTGTAANITARLNQVPAPSGDVALSSHKITGLANGTAPSDAAALGQIPAALPPNGSAGGDLSGTYPGPAVAKVNGVAVSGTAATGKVLTASSAAAASWQDPSVPATVPTQVAFTGAGSGSTGAVTADDLTVQPNAGIGTSASLFLDSTAGQVWELFCNASGQMGIFDKTNSSLALRVLPGSDNAEWQAGVSASTFVSAGGLSGATAGTRLAGATASGPPGSGSFSAGDFVVDKTGTVWVCTAGGSPGTWLPAGAAGPQPLTVNNAATGSLSLSVAAASVYALTLTGNLTLTLTGATAGYAWSAGLYLTQDSTGSRTVTWPAGTRWAGGIAPSLSTTPGATDSVVLETVTGGTTWYGSLVGAAFT